MPEPPAGNLPSIRQGSLFRPREPAFWVYSALLVVTGFLTLSSQSSLRDISGSGWLLSWLLLALYALPVFLVVYLLDLYEHEPLSLVLASFLWGAVAATQIALLANEGWGLVVARLAGPDFSSRWTAALTAPFVEETAKGAGVVLIYLIAREEFDDMLDGFVYGAICGLGFAVVEDVFYFVAVFGGTPTGVLQGFWVRVISSGLYSHVLYTGLVGMGIGYFVTRREHQPLGRRVLVAGGLCFAAVAGHFIWDSPLFDILPHGRLTGAQVLLLPAYLAVKGLPLLAFVVVAVVLARRREHKWLAGSLASEVGLGGISEDELATLERPGLRRRACRDMSTRAGPGAAKLLNRLQREQVNLATARARADGGETPDVVRQRAYCRSLREALAAMPGATLAAEDPADPGR